MQYKELVIGIAMGWEINSVLKNNNELKNTKWIHKTTFF